MGISTYGEAHSGVHAMVSQASPCADDMPPSKLICRCCLRDPRIRPASIEPQGLRGIAASPGSASPPKRGTRLKTGETETVKNRNGHAGWNPGNAHPERIGANQSTAGRCCGLNKERTMILNQSQAEAVYSAMCALNKAGAKIKASIQPVDEDGDWLFVEECPDSGQVTITRGLHRVACHTSQATFAGAYGLQEPDPLQGAVNWLNDALVNCNVRDIQRHLFIGYNRAKRLHGVATACALDHGGELQSGVAAAAGGLTQTAIER